MSDNVKAWPKATGKPLEPPNEIIRPCDYGLYNAVHSAETQLGTIEAYNRLVRWCANLKAKIDAGEAKPQNPIYAKHPRSGR